MAIRRESSVRLGSSYRHAGSFLRLNGAFSALHRLQGRLVSELGIGVGVGDGVGIRVAYTG